MTVSLGCEPPDGPGEGDGFRSRCAENTAYDGLMPPCVFISHSSKDKKRLVDGFAKRLQDANVDIWLDDDRLLPGDSLTRQIFTEGLGGADVVLAVLSSNSIDSSWVREELHSAAILRIEGKCKIVPVILDDVDVPDFLMDTVHVKIADCSSYDSEFRRILNAIRDPSDKQSALDTSVASTAANSSHAPAPTGLAATPAAIEAAVAADDITVRLREAMEELDDLLQNIPAPAKHIGDDEANETVWQWKNKSIIAISLVETAIPNFPSRPISDPALVALVEDMESRASQASAELGKHTGVLGPLGRVTVTTGTSCLLEVRSKLGTVAGCYEEHLWDRISKRGVPLSGPLQYAAPP